MKKHFLAVLLLCYFSPIAYSQSHLANLNSQSSNAHPATSTCTPYRNPQLYGYAESICEGKILFALTEFVNQTFKLPQKLLIVGSECGASNAFYLPGKATIHMCYELVKDIFDRVQREIRADGKTQQQIAMGAFVFIFLHELGHALVDILKLPVLGRSEDAADQIGTFLLISITEKIPGISSYWPVGAHWFFQKDDLFYTQRHYSGRHSLNPQRQFNIACWLYGSNPNKYLQFARNVRLPQQRAQGCPREFMDMRHAANQLLSPYYSDSFKLAIYGNSTNKPIASDYKREQSTNICQPKAQRTPPAIIGLDYHNARFALLSEGWKPTQNLRARPSEISGNAYSFLSRGYAELEDCAGSGLAYCAFLFSDDYGNRLRVITVGEEFSEKKIHATVSKYGFVCDP